jgi:hypothetical protein
MADYRLTAQYPKQQVVRDRNYSGLMVWSAYTLALEIPPEKPDEEWVRERILAEQTPTQINQLVEQTLPYFLQDPATVDNISQYLNAWNDEATETTLSTEIGAVISAFMPRYSATQVSDGQVQTWYNNNGFPPPPPPTNTVVPALLVAGEISPTAAVGDTLTVTTGEWTSEPTHYGYRWMSGFNIVGTDADTYVVAASDSGNSITCNVTATNANGTGSSPPSNAVSITPA